MTDDMKDILAWLVAGGGAVTGAVMGLRKLQKMWSGDGRDIARTEAETYVLTALRAELARAFAQNAAFAIQANEMHGLINELRSQVSLLTDQLTTLKSEIVGLRNKEGVPDEPAA